MMLRTFAALLFGLCLALVSAALELHFIDVGQGDAVLLRAPTGQNVLYDGGEAGSGTLAYLQRLGVEELDIVVASHHHADHIGGLPAVIRAYEPQYFVENGVPHTTRTYERLLDALESADTAIIEAEGQRITLGDVVLQFLPNPGRPGWGHNDNSVGVIVEYGAFRASLMGDAEQQQWDWWLANHAGYLGRVHVHKASHHGSRNGDTAGGIAALSPGAVVISCGPGNRYGHPHDEALALYRQADAEIYRTDQQGTIVVRAAPDGTYHIEPARPGHPVETGDCVDINTANAEALQQITHIGPQYAAQIIELREQKPFRSVDELTRVSGIGEGRLREIKAQGLACVDR